MNRKARETIEQLHMLMQGDTVVAAVSGGADSVALLDFLCAQTDLKLNVRACHVNHCLRGAESERDERLVRTMCEQYGIPLDVLRVDVFAIAKRMRQSVELTAREERYRFFEELAIQYGAKVATAHTLSDTAETVFFNLARGTGLEGLCGIPATRGKIIRPLSACSRQDVEQYCYQHCIAFVNDSSNGDECYTRNYIRRRVVPPFMEINDASLRNIERMTRLLRDDADYLRKQAELCAQDCIEGAGYHVRKLETIHPALRARLLMALLEKNGVGRSEERVLQMQSLMEPSGAHTICLAQNTYASVKDGIIFIERREPPPMLQGACEVRKEELHETRILLAKGKQIEFFVCSASDYEIFKNNPHIDLKVTLDYDMMENVIAVRGRKGGDRMRLVGRGCSKSLKKLYNELAMPNRDFLCVLADSRGVLFAEGAGIDERARVTSDTKTIVAVKIMEEDQ